MSKTYRIKRGLDLKLYGAAEKLVNEYYPELYAVKPTDFIGVIPKMLVKEGENVKAGQQIFFDKKRENIRFTSPVSGIVKEIRRGEKRRIEEVIIASDDKQDFVSFKEIDIAKANAEDIKNTMIEAGIWTFIRQRPYDIIADPKDTPKAIYVKAFDTAPLAPDYDLILKQELELVQKGIDILQKITNAPIYFNLHTKWNNTRLYDGLKGVTKHFFEGKHPAGNLSVQIFNIEPINKGDIVWHINASELCVLGRLFTEGKYDPQKMIALTGSEIEHPRYYRTKLGASVSGLMKEHLKKDNVRIISGNVLTGTKISQEGFICAYDNHITVIPEGDHYSFLGWILPGFKKFSISRTYFSWLQPQKKYRMHTNLNGGRRAFVMTGIYERLLPIDILPMQLCKSCLAKDIEQMEELGIYEVVPEDFALAEVVCPSKIEMQEIIAEALEFVRNEMS